MADKLTVDCSTGQETKAPLTSEEQAERDQLAAAESARRQQDATETTNRTSIEDKLRAALAANRTYKQRPNSEKTAAVVREQVDAVTEQVNGLIRQALRSFDAV